MLLDTVDIVDIAVLSVLCCEHYRSLFRPFNCIVFSVFPRLFSAMLMVNKDVYIKERTALLMLTARFG